MKRLLRRGLAFSIHFSFRAKGISNYSAIKDMMNLEDSGNNMNTF